MACLLAGRVWRGQNAQAGQRITETIKRGRFDGAGWYSLGAGGTVETDSIP